MNKMAICWIRGYFKKWKDVTQYKNVGMSKDLKDRMIRMYMQRLRDAFDLWRNGKNDKNVKEAEMTFSMSMDENADLQG